MAASASRTRSPQGRRGDPHRLRVALSEKHKAELRLAFDLFDSEGTGRIRASEVKVALRALGFEVKKDELRSLLLDVGVAANSPDATMDFNEFLQVLLIKMGARETKEEVQRAFKLFDDADKGYISLDDLKHICTALGQHLSDDELRELMEFALPKGGSGGAESKGGANAGKSGGADATAGVRSGGAAGGDPHGQLVISEEDFMRLMKRANVY